MLWRLPKAPQFCLSSAQHPPSTGSAPPEKVLWVSCVHNKILYIQSRTFCLTFRKAFCAAVRVCLCVCVFVYIYICSSIYAYFSVGLCANCCFSACVVCLHGWLLCHGSELLARHEISTPSPCLSVCWCVSVACCGKCTLVLLFFCCVSLDGTACCRLSILFIIFLTFSDQQSSWASDPEKSSCSTTDTLQEGPYQGRGWFLFFLHSACSCWHRTYKTHSWSI